MHDQFGSRGDIRFPFCVWSSKHLGTPVVTHYWCRKQFSTQHSSQLQSPLPAVFVLFYRFSFLHCSNLMTFHTLLKPQYLKINVTISQISITVKEAKTALIPITYMSDPLTSTDHVTWLHLWQINKDQHKIITISSADEIPIYTYLFRCFLF